MKGMLQGDTEEFLHFLLTLIYRPRPPPQIPPFSLIPVAPVHPTSAAGHGRAESASDSGGLRSTPLDHTHPCTDMRVAVHLTLGEAIVE